MKSKRMHGRASPLWVLYALPVYLLLALLVSVWLVARAWPGNPFNRPLYQVEQRRVAVLQVTATSIKRIEHAMGLLTLLPDNPSAPKVAAADQQELVSCVAYARALLRKCGVGGAGEPKKLAPNPTLWSHDDLSYVQDRILGPAHNLLEARAAALHNAAFPVSFERFFKDLFLAPPPLGVTLTDDEEVQLAQKLAARDYPPESADARDSTSEAGIQRIDGLRQLEFILLLAALGSAGACTHGLASIAKYIGSRRFEAVWTLFYLIRPWVGGVLGPTFYLVLRGGLMTQQAGWKDVNTVGYAAVAILVGFCSAEAMENLRDIGTAFFRGKSGAGSLQSTAPHITTVDGSPDPDDPKKELWLLTIRGTGFAADTQVLLDGRARPAGEIRHEQSSATLLVVLLPAEFAAKGFSVQVLNPGDNPLASNVVTVANPAAGATPTTTH